MADPIEEPLGRSIIYSEVSEVIKTIDRGIRIAVTALIGALAIVPGWQIMTSGTVFGFTLPTTWLTDYAPFQDYFLPGLILLVVIGGGCLATAVINLVSERYGPITSLAMGLVLMGWIAGELLFMNQTMFLTWVILGAGALLVILSAPHALLVRSWSRGTSTNLVG